MVANSGGKVMRKKMREVNCLSRNEGMTPPFGKVTEMLTFGNAISSLLLESWRERQRSELTQF